jgi:hypothetical protein
MPVLHKVLIELDEQDVLRRQEINEASRIQASLNSITQGLLKNKDEWLEPALVYEVYSISEVQPDGIELKNSQTLQISHAAALLKQASEIAIAVCTIGSRLEESVDQYFKSGHSVKGFLLDGLGSAAVDSLAHEACKLINSDAISRGLSSSSPYSPGMYGWNIESLPDLLRLVPGDQIGVRLLSRGMIFPRKSIAMVVGIGKDMHQKSPEETCLLCNLRNTCRQRR